jgi:hypothetical protein
MFVSRTTLLAAAAACLLTSASVAQSSEGAAMAADSHDKACIQLKDANTWSSNLTEMSGVGTVTTLASLLTNLSETYISLTSTTHPPVVGYHSGIQWSTADEATTAWTPQGLTTGASGSTDFSIASWHSTGSGGADEGSRISIVNTTDFNNAATTLYRNVILVNPTGTGTYEPVKIHIGGLALAGNYLYVADTSHGFRVFDLNQIRQVSGSNATCSGVFGKVGSTWCADGYAFMLPQVGAYSMPSTLSNGNAVTAECRPKFSWAGNHTRTFNGVNAFVLSGEYCASPTSGNTAAENQARECENSASGDELDTSGMNGRLYKWPLGSDNKLVTSSGYVNPAEVYYMNERNVQGIGPDMTQNSSGGYTANSFWLATTKSSGELMKVSTGATASPVYTYSASQMPYAPEVLHSTLTGGHLWMVTEGKNGRDRSCQRWPRSDLHRCGIH